MTLIEAIKSGRPFRRKSWRDKDASPHSPGDWIRKAMSGDYFELARDEGPNRNWRFGYLDLEADDWEIQEPTVTITLAQFWEAVNASSSSRLGQEVFLNWQGIEELARRLGLEDDT